MNAGDIVVGVVTKIEPTHLIVKLENDFQGIVHISGASDYYVNNLSSMFEVGTEYNFSVIEHQSNSKRVKLDWKSLHPRYQKNPFKYEINETEQGFENLLKNTLEEVKND